MSDREPLAAVVILNYNYGRFLPDCLASMEAQEYLSLLIVVVDDCSTDNSRAVLDAWASSTARRHLIITKERNRGPAHSMNLAIRSLPAEVAFVGFSDADDVWHPKKLTYMVPALETAGEHCVLVYSHASTFADGTDPTFSDAKGPGVMAPPSVDVGRLLSQGSAFAFNACLVRRRALAVIPPVDESMRVTDYQLWLRLSRVGRFTPLEPARVVAGVRAHPGSMSRTEPNHDDRLRMLGRTPVSKAERAQARIRGRRLLKTSLLTRRRTPLAAYREYGIGAQDPVALLVAVVSILPGRTHVARRVMDLIRFGKGLLRV